jgi:hypothetical protein
VGVVRCALHYQHTHRTSDAGIPSQSTVYATDTAAPASQSRDSKHTART